MGKCGISAPPPPEPYVLAGSYAIPSVPYRAARRALVWANIYGVLIILCAAALIVGLFVMFFAGDKEQKREFNAAEQAQRVLPRSAPQPETEDNGGSQGLHLDPLGRFSGRPGLGWMRF